MWLKNKYDFVFYFFLFSVVITFFWVRPMNSPNHMFIAGDGLGYYSYLPARFIHNDKNYDFKWFNRVYNNNYTYSAFQNPEQNILVEHKGKKINKFYPGLSYIWFPFFAASHVYVKLFHGVPDGFSRPYQLGICAASLFYLLLGLFFLRKLILNLFNNHFAAILVPIVTFYGSHLFTYAIKGNCLSHAYSFTFLVLFVFYLHSFFNQQDEKLKNALWCALFFIITVSIRPLNGLSLLLLPAFIPTRYFKQKLNLGKFNLRHGISLLIIVGALINHFGITWLQTGSLFSYTYSGERFYFEKSRFFDALFSYYIGLFVYVPAFLVSMAGLFFMPFKRRAIFLGFFLMVVFLYSSWWYWPILKRALIDVYVIPAICLGALVSAYPDRKFKILLGILLLFCVSYYQLKEKQISDGILDGSATYKELFWRNFFRLERANIYAVPPSTILKQETFIENFEGKKPLVNLSQKRRYSGKQSFMLDARNYIATVNEQPFPKLFWNQSTKKIRFSFYCYAETGVNMIHAFIQFFDKEGKVIMESPYYMNKETIFTEKWDYKEFGYELTPEDVANRNKIDKIRFTIWNVEAKKEVYIDDLKIEFLLTDKSFDISL